MLVDKTIIEITSNGYSFQQTAIPINLLPKTRICNLSATYYFEVLAF